MGTKAIGFSETNEQSIQSPFVDDKTNFSNENFSSNNSEKIDDYDNDEISRTESITISHNSVSPELKLLSNQNHQLQSDSFLSIKNEIFSISEVKLSLKSLPIIYPT